MPPSPSAPRRWHSPSQSPSAPQGRKSPRSGARGRRTSRDNAATEGTPPGAQLTRDHPQLCFPASVTTWAVHSLTEGMASPVALRSHLAPHWRLVSLHTVLVPGSPRPTRPAPASAQTSDSTPRTGCLSTHTHRRPGPWPRGRWHRPLSKPLPQTQLLHQPVHPPAAAAPPHPRGRLLRGRGGGEGPLPRGLRKAFAFPPICEHGPGGRSPSWNSGDPEGEVTTVPAPTC